MEPARPPSPPQTQPPQLPQLQVRYCGIHGIVIGPDGRCIICKRNKGETTESGSGRTLVGAVLLVAAVVGFALVYKGASQTAAAPPPTPTITPTVAVAPRVVAIPPAGDDPDYVDREEAKGRDELAQSLRKERDLEEATRKVKVRVYATDACDLCRTAEEYLTGKHIAFTVLDVEKDGAAADALRKLRAEPMVPTFEVDGEVVAGFSPRDMDGAIARAAQRRVR